MGGYETLLSHVVPFCLVVFRLAGLFLFAPLLSSSMIPARVRALLAVMLGAAMYPMLPPLAAVHPDASVYEILPMIVGETLIGAVIGIIAAVPLVSLELAGVMSGQQVGFGLARVYNPELEIDSDLFGQVLFYLGAGVFIALDGVETMFRCVAATFARVPLGGIGARDIPLDDFLGILTSGFELGIRVAAPVTGIVLLLVIAFAAVGKTMPQLNIMSVGFTVKILAALAITAAAAHTISVAAGDEVGGAVDRAVAWVNGLGA